jgi:glucosamine--fructose-6-phosphate aminotransferase (isomerizing)
MAGLKRLEYRGYDSAGVAVLADGGLAAAKKAGKLVNLEKELAERPLPAGATGIGHTRWATHGGPTDANAHPHLDNAGRVAVVHNGIIENFALLRAELAERGHALTSETDTEVVAHLLAEEFSATADLAEAMRLVCRRLEGAFTSGSSAPAATPRWWWASARARRSWPPTSPRSSPTPAPRSSWARTRWWSCAGTASR